MGVIRDRQGNAVRSGRHWSFLRPELLSVFAHVDRHARQQLAAEERLVVPIGPEGQDESEGFPTLDLVRTTKMKSSLTKRGMLVRPSKRTRCSVLGWTSLQRNPNLLPEVSKKSFGSCAYGKRRDRVCAELLTLLQTKSSRIPVLSPAPTIWSVRRESGNTSIQI